MKSKYANWNVERLDLSSDINFMLNDNNIENVEMLRKLRRMDLHNLGFSNEQIKEIIIKLQLLGLDLSRK